MSDEKGPWTVSVRPERHQSGWPEKISAQLHRPLVDRRARVDVEVFNDPLHTLPLAIKADCLVLDKSTPH